MDLRRADRHPLGVARALEQDRELLVLHARARAAAQPPLLDDDAALLVDLLRVERQVVRPVLEDEERLLQDLRLVGRDLQHVDRLVEARERVEARPEPHADRLQERDDLLLREVLRAVERHVLDEVREARAGRRPRGREPALTTSRSSARFSGFAVHPDVVAQAVGEPADGDLRIDRQRLRQRRGRWRRGGRRLPARRRLALTACRPAPARRQRGPIRPRAGWTAKAVRRERHDAARCRVTMVRVSCGAR